MFQVLEKEVVHLKQAFIAAGKNGYEPKLTVIIAKKRHNFRMFSVRFKFRLRLWLSTAMIKCQSFDIDWKSRDPLESNLNID